MLIEMLKIPHTKWKKEYKNFYKNGWVRFWHFDWRRIRIKKYQVVNSNPLIKVTDTRVIEIGK